ncbi:hypothetical protein DFH06DRAFT_1327237 [Mycena polygramma]|nr:hypothetical protein DFH06DRAFT_1327237 [Mycena polygramma]
MISPSCTASQRKTSPGPSDRSWRERQREQLAFINTCIAEWGDYIASSHLQRLETKRKELEAAVFSFKYAPGPNVPAEILSNIFILCLPANGRVRPSPHSAPLLLTRVCRQWRERAIATVELWAAVDFTFPNRQERDDHERARQLLETWFTRARGYPLSMTLRSAMHGGLPSFILDAISAFAPQLSRLEIAMPSYPTFHPPSAPFPILANLSLRCTLHTESYRAPSILTVFKNAPQLRNVRLLTGYDLTNVSIGVEARLTSLEIQREISATDLATIFDRYSRLIHLKVSLDPLSRLLSIQYIDNPPPLQSLDSNAPAICDALTLPHLQCLRCTVSQSYHITSLRAFICRSACVLRDLAIRREVTEDYVVEDYELAVLLEEIPSLEILHIDFSPQNLPTFRAIYAHLRSPLLLPRLDTLSVREKLGTDPYHYGNIVTMLRRRRCGARRGRRCLRTFELTLCPSGVMLPEHVIPDGIHSEEIDQLIQRGLRFRVKSCDLEWPSWLAPDELSWSGPDLE